LKRALRGYPLPLRSVLHWPDQTPSRLAFLRAYGRLLAVSRIALTAETRLSRIAATGLEEDVHAQALRTAQRRKWRASEAGGRTAE
jgi:hypothetical protein